MSGLSVRDDVSFEKYLTALNNAEKIAVQEYKVLIGGVLYENVKFPILIGDQPAFFFTRNSKGVLKPNFHILDKRAQLAFFCLEGNIVCTKQKLSDLHVVSQENRVSILSKNDRAVVLDLANEACPFSEAELQISAKTYISPGIPLTLNSSRTLVGNWQPDQHGCFWNMSIRGSIEKKHSAVGLSGKFMMFVNCHFINLYKGISINGR